ncbi:hypothetical protein D5086_030290 [Populus alba]|uniref:Uncharacterized protein n=3 Tax=Populus TaxID=3689 RepID=A0ACC4AN33_POPAL|nr:ATP-dependent RNA helicase DEAH11, chloroplastic-like [Populus alba]KAJ6959411.1 ATP-dependent RNA helicase DEAH11 [Populus alba x Populus x berolinensis]TKR98927.1 hypothetical protein D5086_0000197940 [Populus alba]
MIYSNNHHHSQHRQLQHFNRHRNFRNHQNQSLFVVRLLSNHRNNNRTQSPLETLISQCKPDKSDRNPTSAVAARLFFHDQSDAIAAAVFLWERRLAGDHVYTPVTDFDVNEGDLNERIRGLFKLYAEKVLEGEVVKKLERKIENLAVEIGKFTSFFKRPKGVRVYSENKLKKEALRVEMEVVVKRAEEFRKGMRCLMDCIEGKEIGDLGVFRVYDEGNGRKMGIFYYWSRIHFLILRECRRVENGLPIYGFRSEFLKMLHSQQVMVLIGETGSGKSTQLAQFIADSGVASSGSILCTQPRKIAAISLGKRVGEECNGCYENNSIICYPSYSSSQQFGSKVIYMTDHCLLQNLMKDKKLFGVSCIIVDEAHERSLNTDLLLGLLKELLQERPDLQLIIMSATVDASKLSSYFFGCGTFHVLGRSFPVEIKYAPAASRESLDPLPSSNNAAPYVCDVVKMAMEIHAAEEDGAILAFLTSQAEVEWACEKFQSPSAIALPLHGKLSHEEQCRVFQNYPGKRKVVFATNLAETSLTIPGVKYVVDPGLVKDSRFESSSGMNVLRVSKISQSSANQRAGRAGRTDPGKCYRLYSVSDYQSMDLHQEPEICKVHLGIAVLRILASGIKNVLEFDFIDAPSVDAINKAIRNLVQLGAVACKHDAFALTADGHYLVKLGMEPRLGKIILESLRYGLRKEGVVLAAAMANASNIFCRVGTYDEKLKSDCLKVRFCHHDGDLFTLLSVYREWESIRQENRNKWCWENRINAKTMRRCRDTVLELENCLKNELNFIIPTYWLWDPLVASVHDENMKKIILSSLADNVAMYSGYDRLGYEVVLSGEYFQLHPSCSLQVYNQKPHWVVFAELLSISSQYLVCVTAIDFDSLSTFIHPLFDVSKMESRKLQLRVIKGFGGVALKRFCGKSNSSLTALVSRMRAIYMDERIGIEINVGDNEIQLFASSKDIEKIYEYVNNALIYETKWLRNECLEKCLYHEVRAGASPPVALVGAGAEIKHLELGNRCLTVDVHLSNVNVVDDKEVLTFLEKSVSGICGYNKFTGTGQHGDDAERWGRVSFLTPEAARKALYFNGSELCGCVLKLSLSRSSVGGIRKSSFAAVKAKISWPRRYSKGYAIVRCERNDAQFIVDDCFNVLIGGRFVQCQTSTRDMNSVVIRGLDKETSEAEILEVLHKTTNRRILDVFLIRGDEVNNHSVDAFEQAILKEIAPFMPSQGPLSNYCHVQVFAPEPKDSFMKAWITFDGKLHLEAAKALQHMQGKALAGCFSWQKMQCQQVFHSSASCSASVYAFIERQLNILLKSFKFRPGVCCNLERNENGSYRVKISANATKTVAELRRPLEQLMNGKKVNHCSLTPMVLQLLFSKDGIMLMKSLQQEMGTYILFDRQNLTVRIFGPEKKVALTEQKLIASLLALHDKEQTDIRLRGGAMPYDLMKKVVEKFGPDLHVLKETIPEAEFMLNTRRHVISFSGKKDLRLQVEQMIRDFARSVGVNGSIKRYEDDNIACPICLCEVEDCYQLEACGHKFCQSCLVEQLESAMRGRDGFPVGCAHEGCGMHIWLADLKSLLPCEKLEDLFRASLSAFVASSGGTYRFCPSPDCPSVYRVASGMVGDLFVCGACYAETCTRCHVEYHPFVSCEKYKELKEDPDMSLKEWCKGKEHVKNCPVCGYTIEKVDGCNHIECRCGKHICWVCLEFFMSGDDCYVHLRSEHPATL